MMKKLYLIISLVLFSFFAKAAISGPSHTICPNTACWYYSEYSDSNYTYEWSVTGGSIEHGLNTPSVCIEWYDTNGTHKVSVTVRHGDSNLGTESKTVKVFSLKDLLPANFTKGDFIVRPGDNTPVTYEIPAVYFPQYSGDKPYINEYQWIIPNGWKYNNIISNGTPFATEEPRITVTPDDCTGGTIKVRGVTGCSDASESDYRGKIINRAGNQIISSISTTVCGKPKEITLNIGSVPNAIYQWTKPASWTWTSGTNSNVVKVMPDGLSGGTISVIVDGCTSLKESKTITLYNWDPSDPKPSISGAKVICSSGSTYSLQNAYSNATSITWSASPASLFTNSTGSGASAFLKAKSTTVSGAAEIKFILRNQCGDIHEVKYDVWIGKPVISAQNLEQMLCQKDYFDSENEIQIISEGNDYSADYEWDNLTNNFGFHTFHNKIQIQPYEEGFIAFKVRVENSCGWSNWALFQYPVINCSEGPGGGLLMQSSSNPVNEGIEGDVTLSYRETKSKQLSVSQMELEPAKVITSIAIFPNPVEDIVNIQIPGNLIADNNCSIEIYNLTGKLLLKKKVTSTTNSIDLSNSPSGTYVVKLITDQEIITKKIIKK